MTAYYSDVMCGKLICHGGGDFSQVDSSRTGVKLTVTDVSQPCKTMVSSFTFTDTSDTDLVRDGTGCATGKVTFHLF